MAMGATALEMPPESALPGPVAVEPHDSADRAVVTPGRATVVWAGRSVARRIVMAAGLAFALAVSLPQLRELPATLHALTHANWAWLPVVAVASGVTYLMAAVALRGVAPVPLTLGRAWAVQVAAAFTNRLAPAGLGGMATNVQYLEAAGADRPAAVTAVGLNSLIGFLVHATAVVVLVPLLGLSGAVRGPSHIMFPRYWSLLAVAVATVTQPAIARWGAVGIRRLRRLAASPATSLRAVFTDRRRAKALIVGTAGVTAGYALALVAAVQALGGGVGVGRIVAVYLGGTALAAASPTPGGLGAVETALVAGLSRFGMAAGPALAAVLVYRLVTYWLPVLPGAFLYRSLRQQAVL